MVWFILFLYIFRHSTVIICFGIVYSCNVAALWQSQLRNRRDTSMSGDFSGDPLCEWTTCLPYPSAVKYPADGMPGKHRKPTTAPDYEDYSNIQGCPHLSGSKS
ncbi:hypothetical protein AVEN_28803-1 [Araneus ventricosus]|uniref:Uncharacterized protein n=1 Tax=Araneus ventricosus TaxID=182803 RepID=A0A4Y2IRV8_ARAVE|nr:hypothetical protein AVEN_28803-1 [Araneus ventricosus]